MRSLDDLKACQPLLLYLKSYYHAELKALEEAEGGTSKERQLPKARGAYDFVKVLRDKGVSNTV